MVTKTIGVVEKIDYVEKEFNNLETKFGEDLASVFQNLDNKLEKIFGDQGKFSNLLKGHFGDNGSFG